MTRINSGLPVRLISDQHLVAEHREIKRVPRTLFVSPPPDKFTLNKGHVLFFSNKSRYTFERYKQIHEECIRRGLNVQWYGDNWTPELLSKSVDYIPTKADKMLVIDRIISNASASTQKIRYYKKEISVQDYEKMLRTCL